MAERTKINHLKLNRKQLLHCKWSPSPKKGFGLIPFWSICFIYCSQKHHWFDSTQMWCLRQFLISKSLFDPPSSALHLQSYFSFSPVVSLVNLCASVCVCAHKYMNKDRLKLSLQQDEICTILIIVCVSLQQKWRHIKTPVWKKCWFQDRTLRNATNQESCVRYENSWWKGGKKSKRWHFS